ncbi:MAG: GH3 auxin-responsive promoter family protein [Clostridia bacterium]|nr:GH3 auxin-responsive promoter family protein [Clostridia bacterium]MBR2663769.1 GH3 auxin-responsive promoter family protein [Clostridia bacterium]
MLGNCARANDLSRELLMQIVRDNKDTEYGRLYHFDRIRSIDDYKRLVPFSTYDNYAPYIERMVDKGEKNLITVYPIVQYAETSGSIGVPKKIPVSKRTMEIYTKYTITRVTALADRWQRDHNHHKLPVGRGFNQLEIVDRTLPDGTPLGNISGSAAKSYKKLFPYYLTSPIPVLYPKGYIPMMYLKVRYALADRDTSFMFSVFMTNLVDMMNYIKNNWEWLVEDVRTGTFNKEVKIDEETKAELMKVTKPLPERADELEREFRKGFDDPVIPRIWPKMSFISTIGTGGFAAYTRAMRSFSSSVPIDFQVYGASESMMATCTLIEEPEFALLCDSCFFEFLPADAPEGCTETLNIDQLEVGKEYEIIITNLSGFYRYRIKDVIRALGYEGGSPKITFSYRKSQLLDLAGDKITESMMDEAIRRTGEELGVNIIDYCVYPNRDDSPSHYEFLIEPEQPLDPSPEKCAEYLRILEKHLGEVNPVYKECVDTNEITHAVLYVQQMQTHALWRDIKVHKGTSLNQVKPSACWTPR